MSLVLIVEDEEALRVLAESIIQHPVMRRFRPAPLSRLALLECDQKSDRLFTDLGLRDDLQAAVARKRQLRNSRAAGSLHPIRMPPESEADWATFSD